ncbi:uncharacterized protein LOC111885073 [Lactuca sativa]|uniref:uncharacterized protein LOC111885073 n=1 Tax=Lactuca sativa TaxID=4236 RepID=UPI001C690C95|nr:uncharacterized protein LOC111885073 [Lactuca sativa]
MEGMCGSTSICSKRWRMSFLHGAIRGIQQSGNQLEYSSVQSKNQRFYVVLFILGFWLNKIHMKFMLKSLYFQKQIKVILLVLINALTTLQRQVSTLSAKS